VEIEKEKEKKRIYNPYQNPKSRYYIPEEGRYLHCEEITICCAPLAYFLCCTIIPFGLGNWYREAKLKRREKRELEQRIKEIYANHKERVRISHERNIKLDEERDIEFLRIKNEKLKQLAEEAAIKETTDKIEVLEEQQIDTDKLTKS